MPEYLELDDLEDVVIHFHDIARRIEKELGPDNEMGLEARVLANKLCKFVKEQKYGLS